MTRGKVAFGLGVALAIVMYSFFRCPMCQQVVPGNQRSHHLDVLCPVRRNEIVRQAMEHFDDEASELLR